MVFEILRSVSGRMKIGSRNGGVEIFKKILWTHKWDGHYNFLMQECF